jgi:hypothetical protein
MGVQASVHNSDSSGWANIGGRVVQHLLKAGHDVAVFDLNQAAVDVAVAAGARSVSSPAEAAKDAQVLFLSLPTPAIVEKLVTDLLPSAQQGLVSRPLHHRPGHHPPAGRRVGRRRGGVPGRPGQRRRAGRRGRHPGRDGRR